MTFLRLVNAQGLAGIAASLCLAVLLLVQRSEACHWKGESARYEQLYASERSAFATTIASYRAAADQARAADAANAERVAAEQRVINQRSQNAFETRVADARARAERLRLESGGPADPGPARTASVPGLPAAAGRAAQAAGEDRLPPADALTATEQAIQLDELIQWVRAQARVDNNPKAVANPPRD
jgi:hypothetical protein